MQKNLFFYRFGKVPLGIAVENNAITAVFFGHDAPRKITTSGYIQAQTPLLQKAAAQIEEYLAGKRKKFTLPLSMQGSDFQLAVWQALQKIPYGETRSYKDIAVFIGRPNAARAVGMANNRNPIAIVVPCHRVIGHNGDLVGFGGGLPLKRYLLELEGVHVTR